MAALAPLLPIIEDLLLYYTTQALVEALVSAGIIPAELAPYLGVSLPDKTNAEVDQDVKVVGDILNNPISGLPGILTAVKRNAVDVVGLNTKLDGLITQVSNLPAAPSSGDIAAQVWGYPNSGEDIPAYSHLLYIERFAGLIGKAAAFTLQGDPFLFVETSWKYPPD
jgi:hypothetical protein